MPDAIRNLWERFTTFWRELTSGQKIRVYVMAGILVLVTALTLVFSLRVEYVPLFASTEGISLAPVIAYLDENGIRYQKGTNGQILVDSRSKQNVEFDLSVQAIVSPDVTFADTWSQLSLTATEADKANLWKEFTKNDLVAKLRKFENVENATVNYTKPDKSYWAGEENENLGTAYVMLKTIKALTPEQVDAAARVAASSLGIPEENVTLVDQNLNPLNRGNEGTDIDRASTQEEMRRGRQAELEAKVRDHFLLSVGQNADFDTMTVSANPVLDFDILRSEEKSYTDPNPDGGGFAVIDEQLSESLVNGDAGDIPGTDTNPAAGPGYVTGDGAGSTYDKDHSNQEKVYNQRDTVTEKALGKLVADQSSMSITLWYGKRVATADVLTAEYLDDIRTSASAATGVPANSISVNVQKLAPEESVEPTLMETVSELLDQFGFYLFMLLLLIVMAIALVPRKERAVETPALAGGLEPALAGAGAVGAIAEHELPDISTEEQSEIKRQIDKFVAQKPDAVAQLLRNWLSEDWD
jgi:flagellar M-ring protein FliF